MKIKYPNITLFVLSLVIAVILSWTGVFDSFAELGKLDYLGALIAGLLWPFTFATPLAAASFFYLGQTANIWMIVAVGSIGSLFSDIIIWKFFKGGIFTEFEKIWEDYKNHHRRPFRREHRFHLIQLFHSRPFHFITLFSGVIVLFSPLPDEIGLEMLAYYKLSPAKFVFLSLASAAFAIWVVTGAGRLALG
ncbi:MAG: hypothetical protein Q8P66_02200 [Candidatus Colwellbacteria bacterium]|nr:hypothetical protein [Candidatus Colwellbacteria bacterium]